MSHTEREFRLTPSAGSARKALPLLLAAALLAAPCAAEAANSGGQTQGPWYYGSGGTDATEASNGVVAVDTKTDCVGGGFIFKSSTNVTLSDNKASVMDGASGQEAVAHTCRAHQGQQS